MILLFDSWEDLVSQTTINRPLRIKLPHNQWVCLVRTATTTYIFADECPHLGESLSKGKVNYLGEIVCPWHTYRFQLANGEEQSGKSCKPLKRYRLIIEEEAVYVVVT